jgi:hypothetical protein
MSDFPSLTLKPDSYEAEWVLGGRTFAGNFDARAGRSPRAGIYGEPDGLRAPMRSFPQESEIGLLRGRIRSGQDVVIGDTHLSTWFPDRTIAVGGWALAGLGIAEVPELRLNEMRLQITGLVPLFGVSPIKSVTWPKTPFESDAPTYSATLDNDAHFVWDSGSLKLEASYDGNFTITDGFQHRLRFAPVLTLTAIAPMTPVEWIRRWLEPLWRVVTFLTNVKQELSWVTLGWSFDGEPSEGKRVIGQLFGAGIMQEPYEAVRPDHDEARPLVRLTSLPHSFIDIVSRWRDIDTDDHVFLRILRLVQFQPELPEHARLAFLIQALESLHTAEHAAEDEQAQANYAQRRNDVLEGLTSTRIARDDLQFIKENWSSRRIDSLDRRLRDLIATAPPQVQKALTDLLQTEIGKSMLADDKRTIDAQIRVLRNDLMHGNRHYDAHDLRPWASAVDKLCRVQALRLLGFSQDEIAVLDAWTPTS